MKQSRLHNLFLGAFSLLLIFVTSCSKDDEQNVNSIESNISESIDEFGDAYSTTLKFSINEYPQGDLNSFNTNLLNKLEGNIPVLLSKTDNEFFDVTNAVLQKIEIYENNYKNYLEEIDFGENEAKVEILESISLFNDSFIQSLGSEKILSISEMNTIQY